MKEFELQKKFNWELASEKINSNVSGSQFKYEIGEYVPAEGGVIFHRFITGGIQNYLVVDTENIGAFEWASTNSSYNAISLWNGQSNTNSIVAQNTNTAAYQCTISTRNTKSDWYLPAIEELRLISTNLYNVSQGLEQAGGDDFRYPNPNFWYWSSTSYENDRAWYLNFASKTTSFIYQQSYIYTVRAVRKFTI